jgi:hypothetical protein
LIFSLAFKVVGYDHAATAAEKGAAHLHRDSQFTCAINLRLTSTNIVM